ncbi:MAG: hypothetical protein CMC07_12625 [Flavobacteriaceae bacterium]|jgi:hypothetical protein|nr:hypothetical protein [Flavobacteriaceae bacterium]HBY66618.1 hypothetical protein [Flavobacteriaceae bacterium]|tara:strand:- start:66729 stop:66998 length:270 start_codon:yes stop_codon:yes gene_type:complete
MIKNEQKYLEWIEKNGVGKNDNVASSTKSYISYLNTVSKLIHEDISEKNLYDESCIAEISQKLKGLRSEKSISNYKSALRQYANMVQNT